MQKVSEYGSDFHSFLDIYNTKPVAMVIIDGEWFSYFQVMVQPINLIFRYLQNRTRIQIWLYENTIHRIEGYILG